MTPNEKLDALIAAVGRIDRELSQLTRVVHEDLHAMGKDIHDLAEAVEIGQRTLEAVRDEVYRHGQRVAPVVACPGDCHAVL